MPAQDLDPVGPDEARCLNGLGEGRRGQGLARKSSVQLPGRLLDEQPRAKVVAAFLALRVLLIKKGENDENLYSY